MDIDMNKLHYLLLIVFSMIFIGCSDGNDNFNNILGPLVTDNIYILKDNGLSKIGGSNLELPSGKYSIEITVVSLGISTAFAPENSDNVNIEIIPGRISYSYPIPDEVQYYDKVNVSGIPRQRYVQNLKIEINPSMKDKEIRITLQSHYGLDEIDSSAFTLRWQ
ncbi:MAG: hypothetical protein NC127_06680 [Muribaculum sp.]|nr:hypothetical protein [Muribaculum sp.]